MKIASASPPWKEVLTVGIAVGIGLIIVGTLLLEPAHDDSVYLRTASRERFLQTEECTKECCQKFVEECPSGNPLESLPLALQIVMIVVLILFSALFSGLTLGLMGLDKTGLEIVMDGGDEANAAYARKIYTVRKNGNLLLCTLLLGNVAVNALLSILLADKAGGVIGLIASTFLIVIFGEILPQALCSRYALEIGSRTVPLVRVIIVLFYPVAKPLSMALDKALGEELVTTYSSSEMLKLLEIQVQQNALDKETGKTMLGALTFKDTTVKEVMTPLENTFMVSVEDRLNFETISKIFKTGYSRIPVYEINKNNVIGTLFTKDLIFIDPEDETRVADFVEIFGRGLHMVWPDDKLGDVLRELKTGRTHMAIVRDVNNEDETKDPFYEVKGIITLEDILEEILGDEIVDETDAFVDGTHSERVHRAETFEWARLRLLDSKIVDKRLSYEETMAVTAHLSKNHSKVVSLLTDHQLHRLIADTPVSILNAPSLEFGEKLPADLLYKKGAPTDICTLVLSGKVTILAGNEDFRSDLSSWSLLGAKALSDSSFKPDFNAFVSSGPCRCLQITRVRFAAAVDASTAERLATQISTSIHSSPGRAGRKTDLARASSESDGALGEVDLDRSMRSRKGQMFTALQMARRGSRGDIGSGGSSSHHVVEGSSSPIPEDSAATTKENVP